MCSLPTFTAMPPHRTENLQNLAGPWIRKHLLSSGSVCSRSPSSAAMSLICGADGPDKILFLLLGRKPVSSEELIFDDRAGNRAEQGVVALQRFGARRRHQTQKRTISFSQAILKPCQLSFHVFLDCAVQSAFGSNRPPVDCAPTLDAGLKKQDSSRARFQLKSSADTGFSPALPVEQGASIIRINAKARKKRHHLNHPPGWSEYPKTRHR